MKDLMKNTCDCWSHEYSTAVIFCGPETMQEIVNKIKGLEDWEYAIYNLEKVDNHYEMDFYRWHPYEVCNFLAKFNEVTVYAFMHWDYSLLVTTTGGKENNEFFAEFDSDSPSLSEDYDEGTDEEDMCWDVDIKITDKRTNDTFSIGGGMCSAEDTAKYMHIVRKHGKPIMNYWMLDHITKENGKWFAEVKNKDITIREHTGNVCGWDGMNYDSLKQFLKAHYEIYLPKIGEMKLLKETANRKIYVLQ